MRKLFELVGQITVNGLTGLQGQLTGLEKQMAMADKAISKFGRQAEKIGTNLTKAITVPLAAIGASIGAAALKTGDYADELLDLTDITGLTTDSLQEWENVAREAGVGFDGLIGTISKLTNSMPDIVKGSGPAFEAIKKLGVNVKDSSGNIRDMNSLFPEIIKKLQGVENITERNATAQDLFGKSLADIAPVLGLTSEKLEAAKKEAHDLGLVLSKEDLEAAADFNIEVTKLQAVFASFVMKLGSGFIPIFQDTIIPLIKSRVIPAFQEIAGKIQAVISWFRGLDEQTKNNILKWTAFLAVLGPTIFAVGKFILIGKSLVTTITLIKTAMVGLSVAMATNPFLLIIAAVGALTVALVGAKLAKDRLDESLEKEIITEDTVATELNVRAVEARRTALMALREELIKQGKATTDVDIALSDLVETERKARLTTKERLEEAGRAAREVVELTENEKKARQELSTAWKLQAGEIGKTELELLEQRRNADLEKARSAKATAETIDNINRVYNYRGLQIIEDQEKKEEESSNNKKEIKRDEIEAKTELEKKYYNAVYAMSNSNIDVLEMEKNEAIRIAEEKGASTANVALYYDNLIAQAKRDNLQNNLSDVAGVGNQIEAIWSQGLQNRTIANDNWYAKEKASIENSALSAEEKEKKMEELDKKYQAKSAALKRQAAIKEKIFAVTSSIINTAVAVTKALPNFILAGIVGVLGAIQTAFIAAQPIPLKKGGLAVATEGGIAATVAEGGQDELIMPMETGVETLAEKLIGKIKMALPTLQVPGLAMAGSGGAGRSVNLNVGVLVADERGLKELNRQLNKFNLIENKRMGL